MNGSTLVRGGMPPAISCNQWHEGRGGVKDGKDGDGDVISWMCGVSLRERQSGTELRRYLGVEAIGEVMRRCRLVWHGKKGQCRLCECMC